jgi:hypothetical protein
VIRAAVLTLVLAGPAAAEGLAGEALCAAVWAKVGKGLAGDLTLSGRTAAVDGDWCVVETAVINLAGEYAPDWYADALRFRGSALGWFADGEAPPDGLEVQVENLRIVVQSGNTQLDWLLAAQARAGTIDADLSLAWDAARRELQLERLNIDFPGENQVQASARVGNVDLSSTGAMQMSATGFALTEADLKVTTHGLFEWYLLMTLGPLVLPQEGDMNAAADAIRTDLITDVVNLPSASFSDAAKDALLALIAALPNPSGDLTVALRSEVGIGPARLGGYAVTGVPGTMAEAAPLFQGVTVDVDWTHTDAP